MKRIIISSVFIVIFSFSLFANSGPDSSIDVYTTADCANCITAVNFLKKNWGPVGWDTVPKATLVYPLSNKEYRTQLESLFGNTTDLTIKDIIFPVIIMRNAGEPFSVYYDIDDVEELLKCKLKQTDCKKNSYKSGSIKSGPYCELLTLDETSVESKQASIGNPDGSKYTGQMKKGKMHGQGALTFSDGTVYKGMMKDGKKNGYGVLKFFNGDRYEGQWKNNQMDGYGTFNWVNGSWYQGHYKNGKFTGN